MHPQGLPPPICPEHANADVMFWLLRSIGGISSTTNIDSGSDKYPYIVLGPVMQEALHHNRLQRKQARMRYALLSCKQKQTFQQNHEYKLRKNASIYNCHR
uniref:Uncharacterized protein n=1 Tax=Oryza glumipatula TaxID=40148 RepID=A0A0E0AGS5_9ORYZ